MNKLIHYFPELTSSQISQFETLVELYNYWNSKINLISRKDINEIEVRHFLHSLSIAKFFSFKPKTNILDIGTGGGFPGIPLAVIFPEVNFHLTDSIGKKIKVVNEIKNNLGLKNVYAEHIRSENVKNSYDFIVNRAVTNMSNLVSLIGDKISNINNHGSINNGIISLKGGDLENELNPFKNSKIYQLNELFDEPFFETKKIVYLPIPYMGKDN
ncbi:MAG: 16S rRNA (guanine(527)-N(7))-methyltransferase RsmG [Flavobacteriaceae bacterium]